MKPPELRNASIVASSSTRFSFTITPFGPPTKPSSSEPGHSLMVWDASSSHYTLGIMLIATVILLPIVLLYTAWVYKVLWGKVRESDVNKDMY